MAHAADDAAGRPGAGDPFPQDGRGSEVVRRAPAAGQEDDVVGLERQRADRAAADDFGLEGGVPAGAAIGAATPQRNDIGSNGTSPPSIEATSTVMPASSKA
ncbi:hypothetical protein [Phenylobacterium sp.]|uniref:hypothetical protein n=1 Tax=Phenylobacterium sp. TaxID=1871053 RepID=UPI002ED894CF